jgi:hypothetical protein
MVSWAAGMHAGCARRAPDQVVVVTSRTPASLKAVQRACPPHEAEHCPIRAPAAPDRRRRRHRPHRRHATAAARRQPPGCRRPWHPDGPGIPVDGTQFDFREPRLIGELKLDTAFTDLQRDDDGCARIRLTAPGADRHAELWLDDTYDFVMAFTGDSLPDPARRRRALGLEPMTCAPNAFRSGDGLRTLQPGEATASRWGFARVEF